MSKHHHQVDPIIGDAVGSQLRSLYDDFASQAVPDRFADLIAQLEKLEEIEAEATKRDAGSGGSDADSDRGGNQ